jgi:hypothetical protein
LSHQPAVKPAPRAGESVPAIEKPHALRDHFRPLGLQAAPKEEQNCKMLRFRVRPNDFRAGNPATVAPGMDKIEAKQCSNPHTQELRGQPFLPVFGILYEASLFTGPEVAVWQVVVYPYDLASLPFRFPLACPEPMGQVNEDAYRSIDNPHGLLL